MFNIQSIAERQYLLCVLRPEVRYETRAAIGWFKNRTIRKTAVREDDLSRVSVRSTGENSKRRSGFNQIALFGQDFVQIFKVNTDTTHRTYDLAKTDGYGKNSCLQSACLLAGEYFCPFFSFYIALSRGKQSRLFGFI